MRKLRTSVWMLRHRRSTATRSRARSCPGCASSRISRSRPGPNPSLNCTTSCARSSKRGTRRDRMPDAASDGGDEIEGADQAGGARDGLPARLDAELVRRGLARSRALAVEAVAGGRVTVDGKQALKASLRVSPDAELGLIGDDGYVSRSAHKLAAALDAFAVVVEGRLALDVGASTGGFTQVLLERGARRVIALDVGHGQLAVPVRED